MKKTRIILLLFYGIDCAEHRNYRIFTITKDGYEVEQIRY